MRWIHKSDRISSTEVKQWSSRVFCFSFYLSRVCIFRKEFFLRLNLCSAGVSAGGDESCDATYILTLPIWEVYSVNLTEHKKFCIQKVSNVSNTASSMNETQVEDEFSLIYSVRSPINVLLFNFYYYELTQDCYDAFIGYVLEAVTEISDAMTEDPEKIIDIIFAGVRLPTDWPMKCIANELTSMFPAIIHHLDEVVETIYSFYEEPKLSYLQNKGFPARSRKDREK